MGDLFSGITGIQFPQVVMNQGPLPSQGNLPPPLHSTPDSRINYGSTLLGDLQPYAYGEPGYLSSQSAYLNIPHKYQKIIPPLHLPEPDGRELFKLSHGVDDSDICFVLRLNRNSIFCSGTRHRTSRSTLPTLVDPFVNLATVNYILAGIQLNAHDMQTNPKNLWKEFLVSLEPMLKSYIEKGEFAYETLLFLVSTAMKPFGVARGSEKQGGQHEMTNTAVQWPVPAMTTMTVDGKEINLYNIWYNNEICAGDDLALVLELMPIRPYTLNHYYKGISKKTFEREGYVMQLVPKVRGHVPDWIDSADKVVASIVDKSYEEVGTRSKFCISMLGIIIQPFEEKVGSSSSTSVTWTSDNRGTYWMDRGYWHIAKSQVRMGALGGVDYYHNDMSDQLRAPLLEVTFQPDFVLFSKTLVALTLKKHSERFSFAGGIQTKALSTPKDKPAPARLETRLEKVFKMPASTVDRSEPPRRWPQPQRSREQSESEEMEPAADRPWSQSKVFELRRAREERERARESSKRLSWSRTLEEPPKRTGEEALKRPLERSDSAAFKSPDPKVARVEPAAPAVHATIPGESQKLLRESLNIPVPKDEYMAPPEAPPMVHQQGKKRGGRKAMSVTQEGSVVETSGMMI